MSASTCSDPLIPALGSLGDDLLAMSPRQRRLALARPIIGLAAYAFAAYAHFWWLTPFIVFLVFVAVVTVTHDVVHGSLGLSSHNLPELSRRLEEPFRRAGVQPWRVS